MQSLCKDIDDEMRLLIALISDMGMRLGEAGGLLKEDIKLDDRTPYIDLKSHSWSSLKTKSSQKLIPLTKEALWAYNRLIMIVSLRFPDTVMKQAAKLIQLVVDCISGCINMCQRTASFIASDIVFVTD